MKHIVLISCVSKKLPYKAQVRDLYQSPLFKLSLRYARTLNPDMIFVLSAKHGLLDPEQEIEPYDITLNKMSTAERKSWSKDVLEQLEKVSDLKNDHFTFLAGVNYRKYLIPHIANYSIPMEGLRIGEQLKYLKKILKDE